MDQYQYTSDYDCHSIYKSIKIHIYLINIFEADIGDNYAALFEADIVQLNDGQCKLIFSHLREYAVDRWGI